MFPVLVSVGCIKCCYINYLYYYIKLVIHILVISYLLLVSIKKACYVVRTLTYEYWNKNIVFEYRFYNQHSETFVGSHTFSHSCQVFELLCTTASEIEIFALFNDRKYRLNKTNISV